ncbi:MAG TPA: exodeoxyribonuclease VII large subunit [Acidimicrobiales bacterium]|nr:exodeoxyribonuclease VII large subunit [Acidimicrobiales bacterium]
MATEGAQPALFDVERTWGVGELSARITRALASAFPAEVWVRGEVDGLRPPNRNGHQYFSLTERNNRRGPVSTLNVTLLDRDRRRIDRELDAWPDFKLRDGLEIRVRAKVQLGFGRLSLLVSAVDPEHTLGRMAADRERIRAALRAEGLLEAQQRLALPVVPLHVGLVTSDGSAACEDVLAELRASGLGFRVSIADAQVQGAHADLSILRALHRLSDVRPQVVLIVRGGGARTDLATFDSERLARAIAAHPVPVLAGIGHEIDSSIVDDVAHATFKTPTATAAFVVERVRAAHQRAGDAWTAIARVARAHVGRADDRLAQRAGRLVALASTATGRADERVTARAVRVGGLARARLREAGSRIDVLAARTDAADPARVLARGWSLTRTADGRLVRSVADAAAGTSIVTTLADGEVRSTVESP